MALQPSPRQQVHTPVHIPATVPTQEPAQLGMTLEYFLTELDAGAQAPVAADDAKGLLTVGLATGQSGLRYF